MIIRKRNKYTVDIIYRDSPGKHERAKCIKQKSFASRRQAVKYVKEFSEQKAKREQDYRVVDRMYTWLAHRKEWTAFINKTEEE